MNLFIVIMNYNKTIKQVLIIIWKTKGAALSRLGGVGN